MFGGHVYRNTGAAAVLLLTIGLFVLKSTAAPRPGEASDEEAIVSTIEAVFSATERADFASLDSLYAGADLTIIEGAGIDRGWTEYRDHHLKPELENFQSLVYRPYEIEPHVEGELAWAIFRYELKVDLRERRIDNLGRGTAILEKRNGRWVVRHMQTASRARQ